MEYEYKVKTFKYSVKGCGVKDDGWNEEKCIQFADFLNKQAKDGWRLHSQDYRKAKLGGCFNNEGKTLVCTFEREKDE